MKKTVIYMRQSLDSEKQPNSSNMQKMACLNYASEQGWLIDEIYDEGQSSARKTKIHERPVMNRLISDIKNGLIKRVLVFKRDRLARNAAQYLEILKLLKQTNTEIHFTAGNEPPIFTGTTGDFIEAILAGISEYEADNIVRRIQASMFPLAQKGKWVAGTEPYGYERKKLTKAEMKDESIFNLVLVKKEIEVVKSVFENFNRDDMKLLYGQGFTSICTKLKEGPALQLLTNKQIWRILRQPLYKGEMVQYLDGIKITASCPSFKVIDVDVWDKVNDILDMLGVAPLFLHGENMDEERVAVSPPYLSGVLHCFKCNQLMTHTKKTYKCLNKNCKNRPRIDTLNQEVCEAIFHNLLKKADVEWDKLKGTIRKMINEPLDKISVQKSKEVEQLKSKIKTAFQLHLLKRDEETKVILEHLISEYAESTKTLGKILNQLVNMNKFVDTLTKSDILALVKKQKLSSFHQESLLTLVKSVHYNKESCKINLYKVAIRGGK